MHILSYHPILFKVYSFAAVSHLVVIAEKIQEKAPLAEVCISQITRENVKDYHGFNIGTNKQMVAGHYYYLLEGNQGLLGRG
jgi:hypothetical protein